MAPDTGSTELSAGEMAYKLRQRLGLTHKILDGEKIGKPPADVPLSQFEDRSILRNRERKVLFDCGITTIDQLAVFTARRLRRRRRVGNDCLDRVRRFLAANGRNLEGDPPPS
jgi:hypothetical protein